MLIALPQAPSWPRATLDALAAGHGGEPAGIEGAWGAWFARSSDAIAAAIAVQRALGDPAARIGVHTGDPADPAVPRLARHLALASAEPHAFVSQRTWEAASGYLPALASLVHAGEHVLPDLGAPRAVYRLEHPDLSPPSPAVEGVGAFPNTLPPQSTSLVGRDDDIAHVARSIAPGRCVTITGPGGVGKSRVAVHAAAEALAACGTAWFVPLDAIAAGEPPAARVASEMGLRETPGEDAVSALIAALAAEPALVLLDSCEHVLDEARALVDALIQACPNVRVLATSRQPLGVRDELVIAVEPLPLSQPGPGYAPAVRLFLERAGLPDHEAPAAVAVCTACDGLPLAIELAASLTRLLTPGEIAERLGTRRLTLADTTGARAERQRTLDALIEWSWDLLDDDQRSVLAGLSVFHGGCDLDAAEQVCEAADVLGSIAALVDRSLVFVERRTGRARYRLLDTIRAFASDRVDDPGRLARRHRDQVLAFAREAAAHLRGAQQLEWIERLSSEHDNVRAALGWSIGTAGELEAGVDLISSLQRFWQTRAHGREAVAWIDLALGAGAAGVTRARLCVAAAEHLYLTDQERAQVMLDEASPLIGADASLRGRHRLMAGNVATMLARYDEALSHYSEGRAAFAEAGDATGVAMATGNIASTLHSVNKLDDAQDAYDETVSAFTTLGDVRSVAMARMNLGTLLHDRGRFAEARDEYARAIGVYRSLGDRFNAALGANNLGNALAALGSDDLALEHFRDALEIWLEQGFDLGVRIAIGAIADVCESVGDLERAAVLYGWNPAAGATEAEQAQRRTRIARVRADLGEAAFEEAAARGVRCDRAAIAEIARSGPDRAERPTPRSSAGVFRREGDVWVIGLDERTVRLRDAKGLRYIAALLREPGREVHAADLAGIAGEAPMGHAGELLDAGAKAAYRRRLADLEEEEAEAERWGDRERSARARHERDAIARELAAAVGLGGRSRRASDDAERIRKAVTNRIKAALGRIAREEPLTGRHLERSIRTGTFCSYSPDREIGWDL